VFETPISISEVTHYIMGVLQTDDRLQNVWVTGEISNMRRYSSGHCYFTLKDGGAELRSVMWKSTADRLNTIPSDGSSVIAHGSISVYAARGEYQLVVDRLRPVGIGDLYAQYEALKARLELEGLFDEARKRPLPAYPRVIGVVTSADAAAFQDVQNVLRRRYPLVRVLLAPTLVQGVEAPPAIVRALEILDRRDDVDVILVCRGGGSIEDLWAFNDERVARAIARSRIPVVSGVGHETDFTIADFVADRRAPTPSAAAEILTPDINELRLSLLRLQRDLLDTTRGAISEKRRALSDESRALRGASPLNTIRAARQRIDGLSGRVAAAERGRLTVRAAKLDSLGARLHAASPAAILARGYVLVRRADDGTRAKTAAELSVNDDVILQFNDGERNAKVQN